MAIIVKVSYIISTQLKSGSNSLIVVVSPRLLQLKIEDQIHWR